MFFALSKILSYAIMPLTIVCVLFIVSAIVKKESRKKRLFIAGLFLLLFFCNDFLCNEVMKLWELPATPMNNVTRAYTWGILLTGVTKYEAGPKDRVYFSCGADRVTHTVQLYKLGKIKKILVSGGSGQLDAPERKEALEIAEALLLMGVPSEDIVTESESRNTHESAVAVKKMLSDKSNPSDCLLITSAYHMRRSMACFQKAGMNFDFFTVDFHSHKRKFTFDSLLVPKIDSFRDWHILFKEWIGILAYKAAGYI